MSIIIKVVTGVQILPSFREAYVFYIENIKGILNISEKRRFPLFHNLNAWVVIPYSASGSRLGDGDDEASVGKNLRRDETGKNEAKERKKRKRSDATGTWISTHGNAKEKHRSVCCLR